MKWKIVIGILITILLLGGLFVYIQIRSITDKSLIKSQKKPDEVYVTLEQKIAHKKPFSILLLGYAGGKHDGTYLTDSMIAARVDPSAKKIYLVSIPRDTWITIPSTAGTSDHWKINAAYQIGLDDKGYPNKPSAYTGESGGANLAKYVTSQVLGQSIDYMVAIDFAGFKNTIDTLGGVDVQVDTTFDDFAYPLDVVPDESCGHSSDEIEKFTATVSAEPQLWEYFSCRYKHLHFDKGTTHMNGTTALEYVRSRHSAVDGSDFGRARRQRNLILAVKQQIMSAGFIPKVIPFIESLGNDLKTDLTLSDIKALLQYAGDIGSYEIHTYALTDKNFLNITTSEKGASILAPKEGIDNWSKIHSWIADIYAGKPEQTPAIVRVENGTKKSGLALKVTDLLQKSSIQTVEPVNSKEKTDKTIITVYNKAIQANDIASILKLLNVQTVVYDTHTSDEFNIKILLGDDYTSSPTPTVQ